MGTKLYVGGLPYAATESQLSNLFSTHGTVESARVITDKFTGQSRGFGFVEMSTAEEAKAAITALNGSDMDGRQLTVNEAKPQEARSGGGGGGGRFGGGENRGGRSRFFFALRLVRLLLVRLSPQRFQTRPLGLAVQPSLGRSLRRLCRTTRQTQHRH